MQNRKKILVAFLLVAVMIIGVGYAAFTDTLTIIGNAVIDIKKAEETYEENVYFSAAEFIDAESTGTGDKSKDTIGGVDSDDASFAIHSLAIVGEKRVMKFTITNDSNVDVKISIPATKLSGDNNPSNSNEDAFSIEYAYSNPDMTIAKQGGTLVITVTITVAEPITVQTGATFGIEYTATSIDN